MECPCVNLTLRWGSTLLAFERRVTFLSTQDEEGCFASLCSRSDIHAAGLACSLRPAPFLVSFSEESTFIRCHAASQALFLFLNFDSQQQDLPIFVRRGGGVHHRTYAVTFLFRNAEPRSYSDPHAAGISRSVTQVCPHFANGARYLLRIGIDRMSPYC